MTFLINCRIFVGILYGPVLLLLFKVDMYKIISISSVGVIKNVLLFLFFKKSEKCLEEWEISCLIFPATVEK